MSGPQSVSQLLKPDLSLLRVTDNPYKSDCQGVDNVSSVECKEVAIDSSDWI